MELGVPDVAVVALFGTCHLSARDGRHLTRGARHREAVPNTHGLVVVAQHVEVAVALPQRPGYEHDGISPASRRERAEELGAAHDGTRGGGVVQDLAVRQLVRADGGQPLPHERIHVVEEARRRRKDERVAHPAHALALRAVGGYVDEVTTRRPEHVLQKPVETCVARDHAAGAQHVRPDGVGLDACGVKGTLQRLVPAFDAYEAEAVEGERGLEALALPTPHKHVTLVLVATDDVLKGAPAQGS